MLAGVLLLGHEIGWERQAGLSKAKISNLEEQLVKERQKVDDLIEGIERFETELEGIKGDSMKSVSLSLEASRLYQDLEERTKLLSQVNEALMNTLSKKYEEDGEVMPPMQTGGQR